MFDRALYRARGGMYHHRVAFEVIVITNRKSITSDTTIDGITPLQRT
jgi:hypothetical protein